MVRSSVLTAVVVIVTCVAVPLFGQAGPAADANAPRTLSQYLQYAAIHNPGLKAAFEEWKAALEQIPQARALPDPQFTYGYFIEKIDTRQRAGIMQEFPWFGKIEARTDAATAAVKAAQRRYEATRLELFSQVKVVFYEYAYLAAAIRIAGESVELMRHFEEVARTKYITSTATHPDIIRAQIQLAELQDQFVALERRRDPTVGRIDAVLNRRTPAPLPWPEAGPVQETHVDRARLVAALRESNPQLQAAAFDVERLGREVDLAKRDFYPSIGVGVEWMDMDDDAMADTVKNDEVVVGVGLNLPIWRRSYRAGEQQARAAARRARYERAQLENDLVARAERTLYEFDDSGRKLRLCETVLVPKAQELMRASETAYTAGTVDFLSLIDAQQTLLQYQLQRERARADRQQRLAELEVLAGTEFPRAAVPGGLN
ncbi:MAG TPA: TolC family protein [Sedimentisphaerales bacterium]|jgi:outer membrane protein TolC|nr:TolC family protein [Sedimentisphaerales bacterium]HNU30678.1 TolC family protein [Sedimentisphaerales bacterium]